MPIKTIFLDRDGVINKEIHYLHKIDDFEFIDGIFDACLYFQSLGYKIIIITNQSGISRGYYTESDYQKITQWMLYQFKYKNINILDVFHCLMVQTPLVIAESQSQACFLKPKLNITQTWKNPG